jgi:hypothetical protein
MNDLMLFWSVKPWVIVCSGALLILWSSGNPQTSGPKPRTPAPLTRNAAMKMNDADLEMTIAEHIEGGLSSDHQTRDRQIRRMSKGQLMVLSTFEMEAEVNNGGFVQYYWNTDGELSNAAANGFKLIKAMKIAKLVNQANALWKSERQKVLAYKNKGTNEAFTESYKHTELTKLDDKFYEIEKVENVTKLRVAYIRAHLAEFVGK